MTNFRDEHSMRLRRLTCFAAIIAALPCATFGGEPDSSSAMSDTAVTVSFKLADLEETLSGIRAMVLGSWNYKWGDTWLRCYGVTPKEFFSTFGQDVVGAVGDDSTLTAEDVAGIALIAVQALEKRTEILRDQLAARDEQILDLKSGLSEMRTVAFQFEQKLRKLYESHKTLQARLEELEVPAPPAAKMASSR